METVFITELPQDEYGNRGATLPDPMVVEATYKDDTHHGYTFRSYKFLAPQEFAEKWTGYWRGAVWVEVAGPARHLTEAEYVQVLEAAGVDAKRLEWAKFRERAKREKR